MTFFNIFRKIITFFRGSEKTQTSPNESSSIDSHTSNTLDEQDAKSAEGPKTKQDSEIAFDEIDIYYKNNDHLPKRAIEVDLVAEFDMIVAEPAPVPEKVMNVDLEVTLEKLLHRNDELTKRLEAEQHKMQKAQRKFLLGLLKVADALDRILDQRLNSANAERIAQRQRRNIETTRRLLAQQLKKEGVSKIELIGKLLDPTVADIEDYEENPDLPDETVISEIMSAYRWHDGILRRAKVIISSDE